MPTGKEIYDLAIKHIGEKYILGSLAPKNNSNWKGPWDCAEFTSWCVYQVSNKLYGCLDNTENPAGADAYTGYWGRDAKIIGKKISVSNAMKIEGAALLRLSNVGRNIGHIVFSDGKGGTIEAHSSKMGVIKSTAQGRRWDMGILIPWIDYEKQNQVEVENIGQVFRLKKPMMRDDMIKIIQEKLNESGFKTDIDGIFGHNTYAAVRAYQTSKGLVVDGEVGKEMLLSLGIK